MEYLTMENWSPYVSGIGIGILSWLTFLLSDKPIGCSTSFATTFGILEKLFRGNKIESKEYYKKVPPRINWQWMFVLGIIIGSAVSSLLSGTFQWNWVPGIWVTEISPNIFLRLILGFIGGIFIGLGSRWAGGCTSGHGISGIIQTAVSSWVAVFFYFGTAIVLASILYN